MSSFYIILITVFEVAVCVLHTPSERGTDKKIDKLINFIIIIITILYRMHAKSKTTGANARKNRLHSHTHTLKLNV